ncbi:substrate-binding domain-containing protein [Bifidobacterium callitrichos]|nr:substrate-binding domain-containing protein [Bifidobacterium callitrichos]
MADIISTSDITAVNGTDASTSDTGTGASTGTGAAKRDYLPAERQNMILNLLTRQSVATVAELAKMLDTTEITVRRDLTVLSKAGLLKRIRGGAMSVSSSASANGKPSIVDIATSALSERTPSGGIAIKPVPHSLELGSDQPAIGVMLPEPSFFWPGVIEQMRKIASRLGLRIITRETAYDVDAHEDEILADMIQDPTICGLIVAPSVHSYGKRTWDWLATCEMPTVVIERDLPLLCEHFVDSVRTNHPYGVRKAAVHFLQHGHRSIGAAFTDTPTSAMIQEGWRDVIESTDEIQCPFAFEGIQPYDTKGVNGIVDKILLSGVTAMLVHSDYLAIAIAQTLERRGKRVPDDLSMISVDGFATPSSRPLTVLRSSDKDLAEAAIRTLLERIQDPDRATRHVLVDPNLIDRGSVIDVR